MQNMKKIGEIEFRFLTISCGMVDKKLNSVKYIRNTLVYEKCNIEPIEKELIVHSLNFLE